MLNTNNVTLRNEDAMREVDDDHKLAGRKLAGRKLWACDQRSTQFKRFWRAADEGSGTMAGVMLILLAGVLMGVVAAVGNLMICQTRARSIADVAVVSAAGLYWRDRTGDPCAIVRRIAVSDDARVVACDVEGDDVTVKIAVVTQVPFASEVSREARAGPLACAISH